MAVAWTEVVAGIKQVKLREYSAGAWRKLAGSASSGGISGTGGDSQSPTLAYHGGELFAAWETFNSLHREIYAAHYNGLAWSAAGAGANTNAGVSATFGQASRPQLAAGGGVLRLAWSDDLLQSYQQQREALYVRRWSGMAFMEELPGDARYGGLSATGGHIEALALAVDDAGQPTVVWSDASTGTPEVYLRSQRAALQKTYYVNDSSTGGDSVTAAPGKSTNTGLTPASPLASIQQVLDTYVLGPGDVILIDAGVFAASTSIGAADSGLLLMGPPTGTAHLQGQVTLNGTTATLARLAFSGGLVAMAGAHDHAPRQSDQR